MRIPTAASRWLLLLVLASPGAIAFETDQYLAWGEELADSRGPINDFVNRELARSLERLGRHGADRGCEELPERLYRRLFRSLLVSRLRRFVKHDPAIDRFPPDPVGWWRYLGDSVYRRPWFPFLLPMSRTVRVGEVYFGTDKFGHLFGYFARGYYRRYQSGRRRGLGEEEAMRAAILWGLRGERYLVGGLADGIFSYADLEANFQGLLLARDLCEAEPPHLAVAGGRWTLARPVDLADYVNPRFDESYYSNHYPWIRWRLVRPILEREYCPRLGSPEVRRRLETYRALEGDSLSAVAVAEHFARRGLTLQRDQSLAAICDRDPGGPALTSPQATGRQIAPPRRR